MPSSEKSAQSCTSYVITVNTPAQMAVAACRASCTRRALKSWADARWSIMVAISGPSPIMLSLEGGSTRRAIAVAASPGECCGKAPTHVSAAYTSLRMLVVVQLGVSPRLAASTTGMASLCRGSPSRSAAINSPASRSVESLAIDRVFPPLWNAAAKCYQGAETRFWKNVDRASVLEDDLQWHVLLQHFPQKVFGRSPLQIN